MIDLHALKALATTLYHEKYPEADCLFLAGSVLRGEGTATSDLDIVVLYDKLPNAYRDSYYYAGWPVEAFVHDLETLAYFLADIDRPSGVPSLAAMVAEGLAIPAETRLSRRVKSDAQQFLQAGPSEWSREDINRSRYMITDLIDDLRSPRSNAEMYATAAQLYNAIANHFLRIQGMWSAKGKTIPRRLHRVDEQFAQAFDRAFGQLFTHGNTSGLFDLVSDLLKQEGGFLFDGYRLEAPESWRKPI